MPGTDVCPMLANVCKAGKGFDSASRRLVYDENTVSTYLTICTVCLTKGRRRSCRQQRTFTTLNALLQHRVSQHSDTVIAEAFDRRTDLQTLTGMHLLHKHTKVPPNVSHAVSNASALCRDGQR